jgi:glycosyltransferase involved in cell wall biosynthesis
MARVLVRRPDARLLLAGGKPDQVERARKQAQAAGLGPAVVFAGERPAPEIPAYLLACDVLVSPRSRGTNTPLKIYQYLRSGRVIVATNLRTHTQVLSEDTAALADPTPEAFADAILAAFAEPERAARLGAAGRRLLETAYSEQAYLAKTRQAVGLLLGPPGVESQQTAP